MPRTPLIELTPDQRFKQVAAILAKGAIRHHHRNVRDNDAQQDEKSSEISLDGAMVFRGEDGFKYAFWPHSGEYANMTNFVTSDDYEEKFDNMTLIGMIAGGVWTLNLLDAMLAGVQSKKQFELYFSSRKAQELLVKISFHF